MSDQKILNFNETLTTLDKISKESFIIEVWIPSKKTFVKLKELTAKQQKLIIESVIDSEGKNIFSKAFYQIIKENWLDDISILDDLTVIDKVSIAFFIRKELSNTISVDLSEDPAIVKSFDLLPIIKEIEVYNHPENKKFKYEKNSVSVEVETHIPSFKEEADFDYYVLNSLKKEDKSEDIKNIMITSFISELAKYIKEIKVNENFMDYSNLNILQKIEVAEKLPAGLVRNIFEEIYKIKIDLEKIYTIHYEDMSKIIEINGLLFLVN